MKIKMWFPIRMKILLALLVVVTSVVALITFTMANMFHEDKTAYIRDLTSFTAIGTAEECHSILIGYADRLEVLARVMRNKELSQGEKSEFMRGFFEDFEDLIAVSLAQDGTEIASVLDAGALESVGLSKDDLANYRKEHPLPLKTIQEGEIHVENSTMAGALPMLTLALAKSFSEGERPVVISAEIHLDKLMSLATRSGVFEVLVMDSNKVLLAHPEAAQVLNRMPANAVSDAGVGDESLRAGLTLEYKRDGKEFIAGFANANFGGVVVAAQIPKSAAYLASRDLLKRLLFVALILLATAALAGLLGSRRITRPVERLCAATNDIATGQFDTQLQVQGNDEIGALATSFNQMASGLKERDQALQAAQAQLVQSEKMAAFGQLGAGIAHEVKNPLAGILGCAQLSLRRVENETPVHKNLVLIEKETKRCKTIIENLLRFARQEKAIQKPTDVNAFVEDAIQIVNHQLELKRVKIEKDLEKDLPSILANANQLQQVLMNLVLNAQQSLAGKPGIVKIATRKKDDDGIVIEVSDNGPGMPERVRSKVFEPFFTTKPGGKGTGLGLSVSYGIIEDHGGTISAKSAPGEGTTFIINLRTLRDRPEQTETIAEDHNEEEQKIA